jgi:AcrR family transcriptional regulator
MPRSTVELSAKQRDMLKKEQRILAAAEKLFVENGFFDMSIARIAQKSKCPRTSLYFYFTSREDIVVALACQACGIRLELLRRAVRYPGPGRSRMVALAEAFAIFYRLYPNQFSILYKTTEAICEQASPHRLHQLRHTEEATSDLLRGVIENAVRAGEFARRDIDVEQIHFALVALTVGGFSLHELGFPKTSLHIPDAMDKFWQSLNVLADAYGWQPVSGDTDGEELLADIRRTVFPEETQKIYGPDAWYGHWGNQHPKNRPDGDSTG